MPIHAEQLCDLFVAQGDTWRMVVANHPLGKVDMIVFLYNIRMQLQGVDSRTVISFGMEETPR
jgi:hypothetical protein